MKDQEEGESCGQEGASLSSNPMMTEKFEPEIIAFCCEYCSYAAADLAGSIRMAYPPNIKVILVPCSGRVDPVYLLHALEQGADGVYVTGCMEGDCHFLTGNFKAKKRVAYIRKMLDEMGIEQDRVQMFNIAASDAPEFARVAEMMTEKIRALGPNPVKGRGHPPARLAQGASGG